MDGDCGGERTMANGRQSRMKSPRFVVMLSQIALGIGLASHVYAQEVVNDTSFQIAPQSLQSALLEYSEQAGVQLIIAANTKGLRLRQGLQGKMGLDDALAFLIKDSNLEFFFTGDDTVTIREKITLKLNGRANAQLALERDDEDVDPSRVIEEIISVGTRAKNRTVTETPVPVDVVSSADMATTGQTEVGRMLQILAPSFNFSSSSVSDGTDALRPATLRGLGPDQTLVLVNGKRRHTSALVHVNTSVGRGAAGVDMNAVPASALSHIEVLRDGAAAQYGSDAIAGVINLVLKDGAEGGEATVSYGETYAGDGATTVVASSLGFGIGAGGFLNITADYRNRGSSNRAGLTGAVQYPLLGNGGACDAFDNSGCDPREFSFDRKNFRIGDADSESKSLVFNMKLPIGEALSFYGFGTYSDRKNQSAGFYRRANQYERTVAAIYPDGFLPLINTNIEDYSLSAGLEWRRLDSWDMDFSVNYGTNSFQFVISNSANASLGTYSPTTVEAGTLHINQTTFNFDAVRAVDLGGRQMTVAMGGEYREERYQLEAGERASYINGGHLNKECPGCDVDPVPYDAGFQVFRGFSPENAVDAKRHNVSLYMDVESEVSEAWLFAGAVRAEDYSDFGGTLTGKFSTRYKLTDELAIRGSVSTGFRAPSMQQKNFNSISTQFVEVGGQTVAQERGTFRNNSSIAKLAGVPQLRQETSLNLGAGIVANYKPLTFTADYYHIKINDRIGISGAIDLQQAGFENIAGAASTGQFFVNAADTITDGIDVVATYDFKFGVDQELSLSAAANWTNTKVKAGSIASSIGGVDVGPLITRQDVSILEEWQPKSRMHFTANYAQGNVELVARLSQFGKYTVCEGGCDSASNRQTFGAKWLADIQVKYSFKESGIGLSVGVNNLFDTKPDLNLIGQSGAGEIQGIIASDGVFQYSRRSAPFGFNGGYWYARTTYKF